MRHGNLLRSASPSVVAITNEGVVSDAEGRATRPVPGYVSVSTEELFLQPEGPGVMALLGHRRAYEDEFVAYYAARAGQLRNTAFCCVAIGIWPRT